MQGYGVPAFLNNAEYLLKIGMAYSKHKDSSGIQLNYRKKVIYKGKEYSYHADGKYELIKIIRHELKDDTEEIIQNNQVERDWYNTIDWQSILRRINGESIDAAHDNVEHNDENDDNDRNDDTRNMKRPQSYFKGLWFKCLWKGWPVASWERWRNISKTPIFETYCDENKWIKHNELHAIIDSYTDEEFMETIENIAHYSHPMDRKALKLIINSELNKW